MTVWLLAGLSCLRILKACGEGVTNKMTWSFRVPWKWIPILSDAFVLHKVSLQTEEGSRIHICIDKTGSNLSVWTLARSLGLAPGETSILNFRPLLGSSRRQNKADIPQALKCYHNDVFFALLLKLAFQILTLNQIIRKRLLLHKPQISSTPYGSRRVVLPGTSSCLASHLISPLPHFSHLPIGNNSKTQLLSLFWEWNTCKALTTMPDAWYSFKKVTYNDYYYSVIE